MQVQQSSEFIKHEPCPTCRASGGDHAGNNLARYSDGHGYCHACGAYEHASGDIKTTCGLNEDDANFEALHLEIKPLTNRKIVLSTCKKYNYGYATSKGKRVQAANYYNRKGVLVAQHIRDADKDFKWLGKMSEACLFGQHLWKEGGKRLVITEGEIDCLSIAQLNDCKFPVVSIPNGVSHAPKAIRQNLEFVESFESVIFAFDMDEVGQEAAKECALLLTPNKAHIAHLPLKDANDCLMEGKSKELISALWEAKVYRPDGIKAGTELWEELIKTPPIGYDIPYPDFNELIRGMRLGELYLFTAGSGIGKSTIVNELAYHLKMVHGLPLGVMALEESPSRNLRRYLGIHLNTPLHLPEAHAAVCQEDLRKAYDDVVGDNKWFIYDHFGSTDIDNLLTKIRYMAIGLGIKVLVLDHISIVVSGLDDQGDERKIIDKLMTKLRQLIEETGIMVLAVVHLKRPDKGKSFNEGRQVSLTDLRGSASLEQISDVVIALERDQQGDDPNKAYIRVLKNRPIGQVGTAGSVSYDRATGRLLHCEEDGEEGDYGSPFPKDSTDGDTYPPF